MFSKPKGTGKPRRTPEQKAVLNQRIEQCRALLRLSMSRGDIKRALSQAWGIKPRSVEQYLTVARARNRDFLEASEDQLLADSLAWWIARKQDAERTVKQARERITYAESELQAADETLDEGILVSTEVLQEANKRKSIAFKILEDARRQLFAAEDKAITYQMRIDDLTGVRPAPRTLPEKGEGKGSPSPEIGEPVNVEESQAYMYSLLAKIEQQQETPACNT